jgi:hypothetical protein
MSRAQIARVPLTATEIYDQVHGGPGTAKLANAQRAAMELREELLDSAADVRAMSLEMDEGWQGEAGTAASNAAKPLIMASKQDADLLSTADGAINDQIGAFDTVRNSVVPVPPNPPQITRDDLMATFNSGENVYEQKLGQYNATSQTNIDAFSAYDTASARNGQTVPSSYTTLNAPDSAITLADGNQAKDAGTGAKPGPAGMIGGSVGASGGAPVGGTGGSTSRYQPPGTTAPSGNTVIPAASANPGNGTSASSYRPQPAPSPAPPGGDRFGPTGRLSGNLNTPGPYGGGTGFGPVGSDGAGSNRTPGSRGYRAPGLGGGAGGAGAARPGAGVGGPGSGAPGAPGRGTAAVPPGQSPAGGVRPAASGAPGSAAGARGGVMPMGSGGGRGKGGEDEEHQRAAYLKNADPEATFGGTDEKPTPPVIGEKRST